MLMLQDFTTVSMRRTTRHFSRPVGNRASVVYALNDKWSLHRPIFDRMDSQDE
jgi:hypothetical protein